MASKSNQIAANYAGIAAQTGNLGTPQLHSAGIGNVGVGVKAWESKNGAHSVGVAVDYTKVQKSKADVGFGGGYRFKF